MGTILSHFPSIFRTQYPAPIGRIPFYRRNNYSQKATVIPPSSPLSSLGSLAQVHQSFVVYVGDEYQVRAQVRILS